MEKQTILIVDDEQAIRELLRDFLVNEGFFVLTAENGKVAIETIKSQKVALVVSDIRMPEMGGFELVKLVKKMDPRIGFILMTGYSSIYSEGDVRKIGADDYLSKPLKLSNLLLKIERVLSQMKLLTHKGL